MTVGRIHKAYMIGIGGIGMSAIARYLNAIGVSVQGYDKTPSPITDALQEEGVEVFFTENIQRIPKEVDVVIYTPAIPTQHLELRYYIDNGYNVLKRSEMLGKITLEGNCFAVAGSHGKSTTSAMLAYLLQQGGQQPTAFLGAIANNFNSNFLLGRSHNFVVEADEFDRSFHQLYPAQAIITSVDSDHLDVYGDMEGVRSAFQQFSQQVQPGGQVFIPATEPFLQELPHGLAVTYGVEVDADYRAENVQIVDHKYQFDFISPNGMVQDVVLNMGGWHNVENMVAAAALAHHAGVSMSDIKTGVAGFSGLKRRFDFILDEADLVFIDDYAHHPKEIEAFIHGVRQLFPTEKITAIFQPHLYSRTRDYYKGFAATLSQLDTVILLDIYPAREEAIPGVSSQLIFDELEVEQKYCCSLENILDHIHFHEAQVFLTIGAGDIGLLVPKLKTHLRSHKTQQA